jgi:DNA polymerase type B, organellar and viral
MADFTYREQRAMAGNPIVDNRKGDRHKNRKQTKGSCKHLSKWERREIVAWDGEGANLTDGTHVYNLVCSSNGSNIFNPNGLSTDSILSYFLREGNKKAINVIYGGSYDVNMLLGDLPIEKIRQLWQEGSTFWNKYRIFYAHRKKFTVQEFDPIGRMINTFTLWDVLGYFQATFVNACRKWLGDLPILDEIEAMKHRRSEFDVAHAKEIIDYCRKECDLLVLLVTALFESLDEAGIQLIRYDGAGSIAAALMKKYKVRDYKGEPTDEALRYAQYAYSGGRIEAPKIGNAEGIPIYRYDINSAYPSNAITLPSYRGATWKLSDTWNGNSSSLVHVRWSFKEAPFYPLFFREPDGTILYPQHGEGIYYGAEIKNLVKYHAGEYEIIDSLNVTIRDKTKPFAFIEEVYAIRLMFKAAGSMASESLKLGMNSVYGKLAQQAGYRNGRLPTYHQLLWAGEITSRTRAQLYRAAMSRPESIIAFATDAIICTAPSKVRKGTALGGWTFDKFDGITIVQPGVYFLRSDGSWADKYRGFDKGSLLRDGIVETWLEQETNPEASFHAKLSRFVGMGSALMTTDFRKHWRTWASQDRKLDIRPGGKRVSGNDTCFHDHLCDTIAATNLNIGQISSPYPLAWVPGDTVERPSEFGIDLKIIEQEYQDSYA